MALSRKIFAFDYVIGGWLVFMPWIFGFQKNAIYSWIVIISGLGIIVYSLFTNYEYGLVPFILDVVHILVDIFTAVFLCISPWLFHFSNITYWPHVLTGIFCLIMVLMGGRRRNVR
jgi:hypothetical protein